ncbi:hypothetical protein pdam_00013523 [Pocillopora damicornis]|uniref:Uncharacterized protein n=1 Tax=Pocillopora damicornis TaxID=46731 RepID=A0A3M6TD20_POCDA|nr:hypothetical protein pdam_00013523 [Pocillopora damicornis]
MELKETQPDPEGLSKLIKEKTEMSTKIEALIERVNKSESDYKRVQEKLDKYINCKWQELSQLRKEKTELSTEIEALRERVTKSESDYKTVQEKLNKYINCKWRKYKGTKLIVSA